MKVHTYDSPEAFLERVEHALEEHEAINSLILGIAGQLAHEPGRYSTVPCLKSVDDEGENLLLAAVMTPPHRLVVSSHRGDPVSAAHMLVADLLQSARRVPGVMGPEPVAHAVADAWTERSRQLCRVLRRQRLYELRVTPRPVQVPGRLRKAQRNDADLVGRWRQAFQDEALGGVQEEQPAASVRLRVAAGDIYLWEHEQPVSMVMRTRPTRNGISIGLVYTPPMHRCRGYASACVGALSRELLGGGRAYCALFADTGNPAANRVYQRLGFRPLAEFHEIDFAGQH